MSSRVLRKLQGDKEKELQQPGDNREVLSDVEVDTPVGGSRRKQLNINRYDLLNQNSHSESEVKEDDNETEANRSCEGGNTHESVKKKRKKKKKKSGKHTSTHRSSEDNADIDEVERSVREVNRMLGENVAPKAASAHSGSQRHEKSAPKTILSVQNKHLNPNNELKRIFGSKIVQSEHKRRARGGSRAHMKPTLMVNYKETWPQVGKSNLSMSLLETKNGINYFSYEHSQNYRQAENKFLVAVESLNPDNIVAIIHEHPYHVNALIQLSELCKLSEDLAMAAELIERALYCLEYAFHPLFNVAQGNCRLDYRRQENRALYITIYKHLTFLGGRACSRTSLEFCKLLLALDPDRDPIGVKLAIDFYALRAKEYQWLADLVTELDPTHNLLQLPNFAYNLPVAYFHLGDSRADSYLQDALLMFPGVLLPLLEKCAVSVDSRVIGHQFFGGINDKNTPTSLAQLTTLYVGRNYHIWKDSDLLPWLERNVHEVLDKVDKNEQLVTINKETRNRRYAGPLPLSIGRHIVLSDDVKGITPNVEDSPGPVMSFDPYPPKDAINLYTRPIRPTVANSTANPLALFLGSLWPDFNPNQVQIDVAAGERQEEVQGQANPNPNPEAQGDFRRSVASLVDAMRELLNNIRPEVPNDADIDENDDSADDDLT